MPKRDYPTDDYEAEDSEIDRLRAVLTDIATTVGIGNVAAEKAARALQPRPNAWFAVNRDSGSPFPDKDIYVFEPNCTLSKIYRFRTDPHSLPFDFTAGDVLRDIESRNSDEN